MTPEKGYHVSRRSEHIIIQHPTKETIPEEERKEQKSWKERIEQSQRDKEQERKRGR